MSKYWVLIAAKHQVLEGISGGFAQACHGKAHPLRRMETGDGVIYYSPKIEYGSDQLCQAFTAIGQVTGPGIYLHQLNEENSCYRRQVQYLTSQDVSVKPLINQLNFIKDKQHWGHIFRFGIIRIQFEDFRLIASKMCQSR